MDIGSHVTDKKPVLLICVLQYVPGAQSFIYDQSLLLGLLVGSSEKHETYEGPSPLPQEQRIANPPTGHAIFI